MRSHRCGRELVGRTHLERTGCTARYERRRQGALSRIRIPEGHHPNAQLRGRADAIRLTVLGRGCSAHRPADRCQRTESRGRRRTDPGRRTRGLLRGGLARSAWAIFGEGVRAYLGRRAFFVVDDVDAASLRRRRSDAPALANRPAESSCEFAGVADGAGGKLCWLAAARSPHRHQRFATQCSGRSRSSPQCCDLEKRAGHWSIRRRACQRAIDEIVLRLNSAQEFLATITSKAVRRYQPSRSVAFHASPYGMQGSTRHGVTLRGRCGRLWLDLPVWKTLCGTPWTLLPA